MSGLFNNLPVMPESVVILGTGINGKPYHDALIGEYVIGVNGAINICDLDVWLVKDWRIMENDYYQNPKYSARLKIFARRLKKREDFIKPDYYYKETPGMGAEPEYPLLIRGVLRAGCTIAGAALQLAFWCNVQHIALCGIDMNGQYYFDGSRNRHIELEINGNWKQRRKLDALIAEIISMGRDVVSISPTALEIGNERSW